MKNKFNVVGKKVLRQDGFEKVTGTAKFADDYNYLNQLFGVMVRTSEVHAIIEDINYDEIKNEKDIFIVDALSIPGTKKIGPIKQDQPIFAYEKIVTPGDVVCMLIGSDVERLNELKKKIKIKCKRLNALTDPEKALDNDAEIIHPQFKNNLITHYPLIKGNIEEGFSKADFIIEQTYKTQLIEHAYIEPEAVVAIPMEGKKGVKVIGSIQNPHSTRKVVSQVLNLPLTKVRIIQSDLGGSFGGKDDTMSVLSARAALGAMKTGKPVKIKYSREESVLESYKRHPYILKYKVGYKNSGKITAMKIDLLADGGSYSSMSPFVTWRSVVQATGPYEIDNVLTDVKAVYTNNPYTGAMRGFGSPQPIFAQESIMDEIAISLGMDPVEIRKINGFKFGAMTASGQVLDNHDINLIDVLNTAEKESDFVNQWIKNNKSTSDFPYMNKEFDKNSLLLENDDYIKSGDSLKKGIGLALSYRGCALGAEGIDAAAAYLTIQNDGSLYLLCGLAENGQGLRTTFNIIASEVLGINPERIFYLEQDTGIVPDSGPTVASRSTLMGGNAVKNAAEKLKNRFEKLLLNEWQLPDETGFIFENDVVKTNNSAHFISFSDLCMLAYKKGISLATIGWYKGPSVHWEEETGHGDAYFTYVYGCQVAEITVDIATGELTIDKIVAVHDPGKVINLLGANGQVYGGVTQGAGYGYLEEVTLDNGQIRDLNFDQYLIPTSMDIGDIIPIFIEGKDPYGPFGAKSLGEPTLELTAAAIANAVRNATGKRFFSLPINLEEIVCKRKLYPKSLKRGSA